MKILILGITGLIGSTFFKFLSEKNDLEVFGTVRSGNDLKYFIPKFRSKIIENINFNNNNCSFDFINSINPDVIINCIGLTKHKLNSGHIADFIFLNSLMPHLLNSFAEMTGKRLIHISTDCVFSGSKGNYSEQDVSDCSDVYGRTKFLGEINDSMSALTVRTSTIGHEIKGEFGLLDWFLSRSGKCEGFSRAYFSGLPTVILAEIIYKYILPDKALNGLFHISSYPIDKYSLLRLISAEYDFKIDITDSDFLLIDRTLNCEKFIRKTGYVPMEWSEMVRIMHSYGQGKNV